MDCPLCAHPERQMLENDVINLRMSKRDVAEAIGCRVDEVYDHMTKHIVKQQLRTTDSKRNVLLDTLNKMQNSLEVLINQRTTGPIMNKQLVELAREIRQTIAGLDTLDGNRQQAQKVTIQQYNDFRSIIVTKILGNPKICENCQKLIFEDLEKLEQEHQKQKELDGRPIIQVDRRN